MDSIRPILALCNRLRAVALNRHEMKFQILACETPEYAKAIIDALKRVGNIAPKSASESGKLQQRLIAAGYRSKEALIVFFGIKPRSLSSRLASKAQAPPIRLQHTATIKNARK